MLNNLRVKCTHRTHTRIMYICTYITHTIYMYTLKASDERGGPGVINCANSCTAERVQYAHARSVCFTQFDFN